MQWYRRWLVLLWVTTVLAACSAPKSDKSEGPDRSSWQYSHAQSNYFLERGEYGKALEAANQALERVRIQRGKEHPDVAIALMSVAQIYSLLYNHRFAESHYELALRVRAKTLGRNHLLYSESMLGIGNAYYFQRKYVEAKKSLESALAGAVKNVGWEDSRLIPYLRSVARVYEFTGSYSQALPMRERAAMLTGRQYGVGHNKTAEARLRLANAATHAGEPGKAVSLIEQSLPSIERHHGADSARMALALDLLGLAYAKQNHFSAARPALDRALSIRQRTYGPQHVEVANSYERLANLFEQMGLAVEAYEHREKAKAIRASVRKRI